MATSGFIGSFGVVMSLDPNSYKKKTNRKSKNAKSQIIVDNKTHETK